TVDEADDAAVVTLVGVGAGLAVLDRRRAVDRGTRRGVVGERIHAEQERHDEDHKPDAAAAYDDRPADPTSGPAAATLIFDLRWVEGRAATKCHGRTDRNSVASGVRSCAWRKGLSRPKASGRSIAESRDRRSRDQGWARWKTSTTTIRTATRSSACGSTGTSCSRRSRGPQGRPDEDQGRAGIPDRVLRAP